MFSLWLTASYCMVGANILACDVNFFFLSFGCLKFLFYFSFFFSLSSSLAINICLAKHENIYQILIIPVAIAFIEYFFLNPNFHISSWLLQFFIKIAQNLAVIQRTISFKLSQKHGFYIDKKVSETFGFYWVKIFLFSDLNTTVSTGLFWC